VNARLIAASLALSVVPALVTAAPTAAAAEPCSPTVISLKPHVDEGAIDFPVTFTVCDFSTEVTIKYRDRDADTSWAKFRSRGMQPGTYDWSASVRPQDGQAHRWVSYATLKTVNGDGTVLAKSARVYFKSPAIPVNRVARHP
jgi:hypothetical protein